MKTIKLAFVLPVALMCGCFTLKQTEMPSATMTRAPEGKDVKVAVLGFAASITEYIPMYGYETVYVGHEGHHGRHGRRYCAGGHYETRTTETLLPQVRANEAFIQRARTTMEDAGFLVRTADPQYTVEVTFGGPFVTDGERGVMLAWQFLSILSAEYSTQTWTAKLRIYDAKGGRVLMTKDYSQKYEDCVWSPIFFIGLAGYSENTANFMQSWCLTALTDQTIADATAFLAGR